MSKKSNKSTVATTEASAETPDTTVTSSPSQIIPAEAKRRGRAPKSAEEKAAVLAARKARIASAKAIEKVQSALLGNEIVTTASFWAGVPVETATAIATAIQASADERIKQAEIRELEAKLEALKTH